MQDTPVQITVIKVPPEVAKRWHEQTKEAKRTGQGAKIGTFHKRARQLELSDAITDGVEFPKHYSIKEDAAQSTVPSMLFSSHAEGVTVEGAISQVSAHIDTFTQAYHSAAKSVNTKAAAEKFFTQRDNSLVRVRQGALHAKDNVTRVEKIAKMGKEQFESNREEIEGKLFELFKEKPAWKTADVAKSLRISNAQATMLLTPIASKVASGQFRGEWTLKPEYREQTNPEQVADPMVE